MDAPRKLLVDTLARRPDLDLKNLSLAIGRTIVPTCNNT